MFNLQLEVVKPAVIRVEANHSNRNQVSGIKIGIPSFSSLNSCIIISTAISGNEGNQHMEAQQVQNQE
jgi:hypothetical protein